MKDMNKVFYCTLISRANMHLSQVPTFLGRARDRFIPDRSIESAIRELQEAIKILEKAKESYLELHANVHSSKFIPPK